MVFLELENEHVDVVLVEVLLGRAAARHRRGQNKYGHYPRAMHGAEPHQEVVFETLCRSRDACAVLVAWSRLAWYTDACRSSGGSHACRSLAVIAVDVVFVHFPKDTGNAFAWYVVPPRLPWLLWRYLLES